MFSRNDFTTLAEHRNDYSITIYTPTYRVGRQEEDRIRFKNALALASDKLIERYGLSGPEAEAFLEPARQLAAATDFWANQSDGLVVFVGKDRLDHFRCPIDFEPMVYAAPEFYLRPLVPMIGQDTAFYFLALSRGAVRLYSATRYTIAEIDLQGLVPQNMDAALLLDTAENNLSRAGGAEGQRGSNNPVYFSRGSEPGTDVGGLRTYLNRVDKGISDYLCDDTAPLLLGGAEDLIPIYREANSYAHLFTEGHVAGNLEQDAPGVVHEKATAVIAPHFNQQTARDLKLYGDNLAAGEATSNLDEILPACVNGRVASLWLDRNRYAYGEFESATNTVNIMTDKDKNATELYNLAAVRAVQSGARVYNVSGEELPGGAAGMAAIFRYTAG